MAFATFGYRWILRSVLDQVRLQVLQPDDQVISYFYAPVPGDDDKVRIVAIITEPAWNRSVMVQIGPHRIFMPFFDEDKNLYEHLARANSEKLRVEFKAELFDWPKEPEYLLDFHPEIIREIAG